MGAIWALFVLRLVMVTQDTRRPFKAESTVLLHVPNSSIMPPSVL